jgi:catecholate siderophore receptor
MDSYAGLASEVFGTGSNASGSYVTNIYNPPNTIGGFGSPYLSGNYTIIPVNTQAGYLLETANYNDLIFLNGGVRYDNYNISSTKNTSGKITSVSEQTGLVNYNVGLLVKPLPYASVYGAFATSANPVGAELDATSATYGGLSATATVNQIFGPQRNQAIEFGTKWEFFDKRLLVTGALFQTNVENARESAMINGVAGTVVAGASYRVQGIDLEAAGKINDKWSVMGGLVLMNPKVTNSIIPSNIGLPLANVANQSFNLLTKYEVLDWLELGGQATYRSKILGGSLLAANGGSASNQATVLPSYWSFDTFAEVKIGSNLEAKLYVSNIFNRTYYDAFYQSSRPFTIIAPGRAVSMIVSMKF